jgi:hypothetical protein
VKKQYVSSIRTLAKNENGWHFSAINTSAKQLEDFRIEDMATKMKSLAPDLWDIIGLLLGASSQMSTDEDPDIVMEDTDPGPISRAQRLAERRDALITVVSLADLKQY